MKSFIHTDNRVFTLVGNAPHTTRDKRNIMLMVWQTECSHPGCAATLTVKTVTDTPSGWRNFCPAKYCPTHRIEALRKARANLIAARADGLIRWRESEEGQAAIKKQAEDCMGKIEQMLYNAVADLSLVSEEVLWEEAGRVVMEALPTAPEGKRDTRGQRISRALHSLVAKGRLKYYGGVLTLLR